MKTLIHEDPKIVAAAERQMHSWVLNQESDSRAIHCQQSRCAAPVQRTFVAISREAGAEGSEVAQTLGSELGWEVLDKNLLDRVAERFHESRDMLNLVDETQSNWVFDVIGTWMDHNIIPHEKYIAHLSRIIRAAAQKGSVVMVGRGAQFLAPRKKGLAVRLIASEKYRVERLMERLGLDEAVARRLMRELDQGRQEFVQRFFRRDLRDPHLYDMVLNVEQLGRAAVVEQIRMALAR